jgi:hypothetical protein
MNIRNRYEEMAVSLIEIIKRCGHVTDWEVRQFLLYEVGINYAFSWLSESRKKELKPFLEEFEEYFSRFPHVRSKKIQGSQNMKSANFSKGDPRMAKVNKVYAIENDSLVEGAFLWSNYERVPTLWDKVDKDIVTALTYEVKCPDARDDLKEKIRHLQDALKEAKQLNGLVVKMLENRNKYLE